MIPDNSELLLPIVFVAVMSLLLILVAVLLWMTLRNRKQQGRTPATPTAPATPATTTQPSPQPASAATSRTAPPPGIAYLALESVGHESVYYPLTKSVTTIGRDPLCDIPIDERFAAVSRQHAQIAQEGDDYILVDLNSGNGVFVNGARIGRNRLRDGVTISMGQVVTYTFHRIPAEGAP
jgi:pSer/pThr/pTyr-binding forkhead associated (FHA) protein